MNIFYPATNKKKVIYEEPNMGSVYSPLQDLGNDEKIKMDSQRLRKSASMGAK